MYYIKKQAELKEKTIKDILIEGFRDISEQTITDANNKIIIVTNDNGVYVSNVQPNYSGEDDDGDNDEIYIHCLNEGIFKEAIVNKKYSLRNTLINHFNISAEEIDKYAEDEAKRREKEAMARAEKTKQEEIKKASEIMRKTRKEFISRYSNIHKGDFVEISNPEQILADCPYAAFIPKGMDGDFDEDIVDAGLHSVFLVDLFKPIYNKKAKVIGVDSDAVYLDTSGFPDELDSSSCWPFEFLKLAK